MATTLHWVAGNEYYDIWPVYDYQKIPGATIMQREEMLPANEIQKLGLTDFVGAVTDGKYGAAAFDFRSPHDPLIARKSWFFFDDEYVCLGAGISCKTNLPVVTTLNQCLLRGDVTISSENINQLSEKAKINSTMLIGFFRMELDMFFPNQQQLILKIAKQLVRGGELTNKLIHQKKKSAGMCLNFGSIMARDRAKKPMNILLFRLYYN